MADVNEHATQESRSRGGQRSGEVRRERGKSVRERIAEKLEEEADAVVRVYLDAMKAAAFTLTKDGETIALGADHDTRLKAVKDAMEQAFGRPSQSVEISGPDEGPIVVQHKARLTLDDVANFANNLGADDRPEPSTS